MKKTSVLQATSNVNGIGLNVMLNGHLVAYIGKQEGLGWRVFSRVASHSNGRKHYPTPQAASKAYFGRVFEFVENGDE